MLKQLLDQDLKKSLLSGDKERTEVLRGLKSAILYREVADNARDTGLSEDIMLAVTAKESSKRADSAAIYKQAGAEDRAAKELSEKAIIDEYLPAQLGDAELEKLVTEAVEEFGNDATKMGAIIAKVRAGAGPNADGSKIATLVKSKLG
ncbi:MAG TPA: GatB/YqeY domain-containing protein [Patescibacteria group bacterium]|jgi:uncharacterized protein YqeY|nr:GatB/YqeY domain-containing protein [Patescibacteria group bacterium]